MRRLLSALGATFVLLLGVLSFSQAAHAADGTLTLTPSATTIASGDAVTLTWESTGVIGLEATGDWPTVGPVAASDSVTFQLSNPGFYDFELSGLHEDDDTPISRLVTVEVTGDFVSVVAFCGGFTITNLIDLPVEGGHGSFDNVDPDEWIELGPNETQTFYTDRTEVDISAWSGDLYQEFEGFAIPQDCDVNDDTDNGDDGDTNVDDNTAGAGNASGHPTVAPAAGIADANNNASPLAAGIALLIGASIAARRLRTNN